MKLGQIFDPKLFIVFIQFMMEAEQDKSWIYNDIIYIIYLFFILYIRYTILLFFIAHERCKKAPNGQGDRFPTFCFSVAMVK